MLNKIKEIAKAKGNDKIKVMKQYPELQKVLLYAYDPFKKYHMTAPPVFGNKNCTNGFQPIHTFDILNDIFLRRITGQTALEVVSDHIVTMDPDSAEIFKMIINKDFRCGINVKTINKAFSGLIPLTHTGVEKPAIMLLKNFDKKKAKFPLLAAVKKDGVRARYVNGSLISRQGHPFAGLEHIEAELERYDGTEFDGELCVPGEIFDVASGMIRSHDDTPEAVYWIFDAPSLPGTKVQRWSCLCDLFKRSGCTHLITHHKINNLTILHSVYTWSINKQNEEGIVVYDPNSFYEDKRSYDWMRIVPLKTADCKVIGFFEGKGKHKNSLGGIIVDYKGHEVKVGTGFKEKVDPEFLHCNMNAKTQEGNAAKIKHDFRNVRSFIWEHKELFLEVIAECEFKEETKAGSMRQPRFKRWRWDK